MSYASPRMSTAVLHLHVSTAVLCDPCKLTVYTLSGVRDLDDPEVRKFWEKHAPVCEGKPATKWPSHMESL